ncbi:hypothetical protein [Pseudoxanthomonas sp. JBR18]|uniref:hypothetical protein n=1 Tax=Pseudoxanthomonas sp. JBR18 TaxID=2969308 RepID=UPI002306D7D1|nr:hypothetical protein [Pseudoxanthomonas sp. JBR18]WCE03282.1 hypothetical protein PJ250_14355 [Pseudoxanthomonas sp. JBR18]
MRFSRVSRSLMPALLAISIVGLSGCHWFHKGPKGDYALSEQERPLEVPPDLNAPNTAGAMQVPTVATGASQQAGASAVNTSGFNVSGSRDEVFAKVGDALGTVDGLTIASRAQLLGSYDVSYQGASFLVRVAAITSGTYVSAVDPRGLPATGPEATRLMAELKNRLAGN